MQKKRGTLALVCMLVALMGAWWIAANTPTVTHSVSRTPIVITHATLGTTEKFSGTLAVSACEEVATSIAATTEVPARLSLEFTTSRTGHSCVEGSQPMPFAVSYTAAHAGSLAAVKINTTSIPFTVVESTP